MKKQIVIASDSVLKVLATHDILHLIEDDPKIAADIIIKGAEQKYLKNQHMVS